MLLSTTVMAGHQREGYRVENDHSGIVSIKWLGQVVTAGELKEAMVSPDGQSVAWVEPYLTEHLGFENEGGEERTLGGNLWIAHDGGNPFIVQRPDTSRGIEILFSPRSGVHTWYPNNLTWDSTSAYLYFEASGCLTASYLWRVPQGQSKATLTTMLIDYALRQEEAGPDSLLANQRYIPEASDRISYGWFAYSSDSLDGEYQRSSELVDQPPGRR